jgi:uncharacterized SAM-binding protein YcdF (DUF218 family)
MVTFVAGLVALVLCGRAWHLRTSSSTQARRLAVAGAGAIVVLGIAAVVGESNWLIVSKSIGRLLMPLGLLWLVLLAAAVRAASVGDRRGALRAGAVALAVQVLGNEPLGEALCALLERPYRDDPFAQGSFDAVVVLGGGAALAPHPGYELGLAGDRIYLGARLWAAGQTRLLVTTGVSTPGLGTEPLDSTVATTRLWRDLGIPDEVIVPVTGAAITSQESQGVAALIRERGWRRVGLVTSAWHMRRALGLFRRAGVDVVPLAADHRGDVEWKGFFSVIPVGAGAWLQQKAWWELVGAAVGR